MSPLVKISDHNFGADVSLPIQYLATNEHSGLMPALDKACSKMNIKDVQHRATWKQEIGTQAPTTFAVTPGDVVVLAQLQGKTTQREIAIAATVKRPVLSEADFISIQ